MRRLELVTGATVFERPPVVEAFETSDHDAIRELGWCDCWEAAHTWWAPRQKCTAREFVPYAKVLHSEDPARVLEAFRDLAGEWRPSPSVVRACLHRDTGTDSSTVDTGRGKDRASIGTATQAAGAAYTAGEPECSCGWNSSTWRIDARNVLRCRTCGGLEPGQLYAAEADGLITREEVA